MGLTDEVGSAGRGTQGRAGVRGPGAVRVGAGDRGPCDRTSRRSRLRASFL